MRHLVLDTETTGLSPKDGHRIIEIGAVEMVNLSVTGRSFHLYSRARIRSCKVQHNVQRAAMIALLHAEYLSNPNFPDFFLCHRFVNLNNPIEGELVCVFLG